MGALAVIQEANQELANQGQSTIQVLPPAFTVPTLSPTTAGPTDPQTSPEPSSPGTGPTNTGTSPEPTSPGTGPTNTGTPPSPGSTSSPNTSMTTKTPIGKRLNK